MTDTADHRRLAELDKLIGELGATRLTVEREIANLERERMEIDEHQDAALREQAEIIARLGIE